MRNLIFVCLAFNILFVAACTSVSEPENTIVTKEQEVYNNISSLKSAAAGGDLIVRLTDDLISERVRYLNEKDFSFSHAGLIFEKDNKKYVCHIAPEEQNADTIQLVSIDSFINPVKHLTCALYRYNFSQAEREAMMAGISNYMQKKVKFDRVYDLSTDDELYCSEMISKALKIATNNRIVCKESNVPPRMRPLVASFFRKQHVSPGTVAERKIITVDNLYSMPECSQVLKFKLKYFPGE